MPAMIRYLDHWATAPPKIFGSTGSMMRILVGKANSFIAEIAFSVEILIRLQRLSFLSPNVVYLRREGICVPVTRVAQRKNEDELHGYSSNNKRNIVRVQYFVRRGFVGYRSRASSKHLSPHLPVDELDSSGVKKGLRCRCKMHVWVSGPQRKRLDVDVSEKRRYSSRPLL
ncbi:hypothetical protein TNCV_1276781 [Trichonephila clavipes]|nr:hypothetical protein TNCV_1276781 [Trichonephila clavipes]